MKGTTPTTTKETSPPLAPLTFDSKAGRPSEQSSLSASIMLAVGNDSFNTADSSSMTMDTTSMLPTGGTSTSVSLARGSRPSRLQGSKGDRKIKASGPGPANALKPHRKSKQASVGGEKTEERSLVENHDWSLEEATSLNNSATLSLPGAVSVPGRVATRNTELLESSTSGEDDQDDYDVLEDYLAQDHAGAPTTTGRDPHKNIPTYIASARLVQEDNDDMIQGDQFERKIQKIVESQLQKANPMAVEVAVVPQGEASKICGMTVRAFRISVMVLCLLLSAAIIAGVMVAVQQGADDPTSRSASNGNDTVLPVVVDNGGRPTPSPSVPPLQARTPTEERLLSELRSWIIRTDQEESRFQDASSPHYRALQWLSTDNITLSGDRPTTTILERYVLALLYFGTDGPNWTRQDLNFLTESSVCEWNNKIPPDRLGGLGIYCDISASSVRQVVLYGIGLAGTIPWELSLVSDLQGLSIGTNSLTGSIPVELASLQKLDFFHVALNQLSGTIPTEFGRLTLLTDFHISSNFLSGTLPSEIGLWKNLIDVRMHNNTLSGSIPSELGQWTALTFLSLGYNSFTGILPTQLAHISGLQSIHLYTNQLTGNIPTEFGRWTNLKELYLHENLLTGSLPIELGLLTALEVLNVHSNKLSGTVPTELGLLTSTTTLSLSMNLLTGTLPTELGQMTSVLIFYIDNTMLQGTLPTELAAMKSVQDFWVNQNALTGTLPSQLVR